MFTLLGIEYSPGWEKTLCFILIAASIVIFSMRIYFIVWKCSVLTFQNLLNSDPSVMTRYFPSIDMSEPNAILKIIEKISHTYNFESGR